MIYPSPTLALKGKSFVVVKLPLITIVPGFIVPIVEPNGKSTFVLSPGLVVIRAPPTSILFSEKKPCTA